MRNSRDSRAMAKKTAHGRPVAAGQWARRSGRRCDASGRPGPVPYPVQIDGTELLMELVTDEASRPHGSPRRARAGVLESYFEQTREILGALARAGIAHGDLSPYNVLAAGERLVVIDLPQVVDLVANPQGLELLLRDCRNMCSWFRRRGLEVDEQDLFGEGVAQAW